MLKGVALGFLTYGLFSSADALIKSLGGELPVTEIVFLATLTSFIVILILRPRGERWRDMFRMNHPKRVMLRAACGIISGIGATFAFVTIPLAEAYAIIFLSPVLVTLLSIPLSRHRPTSPSMAPRSRSSRRRRATLTRERRSTSCSTWWSST